MADGQAPVAGRETARFAAGCRDQPQMRRPGRRHGEEVVVPDLEDIVVALFAGLLRGLISGGESDGIAVGAPGELLYARGNLCRLRGVAAGHGHHKQLRTCPHRGEEGEAVSDGRPARGGDTAAVVRGGEVLWR